MAQPGFSPGACLLAAVFRPQSEPHRHVKGGRPFEQAPRLPLGQIRLRDRQIAAASSPLRPRLGRRLSQLIFQRVVALLAGSRYESTHPVGRRGSKGDFGSMRRAVAWGLALALIVALAACGFMRWPLSAAKVGDSLNAAFGASPRLHWSAPQAASFSALPWPSVRIVDARLDDAYGVNLLSAPAAGLNLSLIDLLRGRVIPTGVVLVSPTVTIDIDRPPFAGTAGESAGPASVARRALAPLASLRLSNGILRLVSAKRGVDAVIDNVHGRFNGLTIGDQLRFDLSAVWRKTPIAVAGALNDPETAAKGAPSPMVLALDSPLAKLAFGGSLALSDQPSVHGDLTASIPSIAALASFLDVQPPGVLAANDITITSKVKGAADSLTFGDATLTSAGQTLDGGIRISGPGRGPPRPLRSKAPGRRHIRNRDGWQAQRHADGGYGLWRAPPGRTRRGLCWPRPQIQRAWRTCRRRPRRRGRRFRPADRHRDRRGEIHARGLRRFARRRDLEPDGHGLARGGGRLHPWRQPRGSAAPQPPPADRRRTRHPPRGHDVRQGRGVPGGRRGARSGPTRRHDEPWRQG